uniref:Uncharacterized protein n=1 Tax=Pinguiococcus pyrenoidosus TaxID=172671 RepID=A0A7R9UFG9_9STRA|mmetsp:Transcript_6993/g.26917  ORF Transcript_6993/g.26917 Transcript_6993/m.26917 type:complete len:152 (+) Transcript_6993:191-646(+)
MQTNRQCWAVAVLLFVFRQRVACFSSVRPLRCDRHCEAARSQPRFLRLVLLGAADEPESGFSVPFNSSVPALEASEEVLPAADRFAAPQPLGGELESEFSGIELGISGDIVVVLPALIIGVLGLISLFYVWTYEGSFETVEWENVVDVSGM